MKVNIQNINKPSRIEVLNNETPDGLYYFCLSCGTLCKNAYFLKILGHIFYISDGIIYDDRNYHVRGWNIIRCEPEISIQFNKD